MERPSAWCGRRGATRPSRATRWAQVTGPRGTLFPEPRSEHRGWPGAFRGSAADSWARMVGECGGSQRQHLGLRDALL
jgi:hypothetical protein